MYTKDLEFKINLSEYKDYRLNHTQKDTMTYFSITRKNVLYLDDKLQLDKSLLLKTSSQQRTQSYIHTITNLSEEEKSKRNKENSLRLKNYYNNHPEAKQHLSELRKEYFSDEEVRQQFSELMKDYFESNPKAVEKMKAGLKLYYNSNPNAKQHLSEIQKCPEIQAKIRATKLERYGSETYTNTNKIKQTKLERYGDENYCNVDKIKSTKLERYGNETFNNIEKINQTCLEKYGYEFSCMRPEARMIGSSNSKPNQQFANLLIKNNIDFEQEFSLDKYSYDFKVNDILIEINPTATHNLDWSPFGNHTKVIQKTYHQNKSLCAVSHGFRCIHVWDWDDKDKLIALLLPRPKIYARKCELSIVNVSDTTTFLNKYHIQGSTSTGIQKNTIRLGLYYNNNLVSIMTFGKPRYNKNYEWELIRYCSSHNVVGGAEKLFNYFIKNYSPQSIISYCDFSKFTGKTYEKLGFTEVSMTISKHWFNMKLNKHITDNLLRQQGFDRLLGDIYGTFGKGTSNEQLMLAHEFLEVYDAGQKVFTYIQP